MNRTTWFRARTLTFMGLALLPPLISLALSCFHPDLILRGASLTEKKNGITLEACVTGFSGSQVTAPERVNGDYRVRLPQGVTLFAVWEIFLSLVTIAWLHFILRLALSFRNTNSKPWLPWIAYAPFYLFLIWIWLIPKTFSNTGPFHAFLFFSRHWLVLTVGAFLLLICLHQSAERRVSQMEVI